MNNFHFLINGFQFEASEDNVLNFLDSFKSDHRCIARKGLNGKEILGSVEDVRNYLKVYYLTSVR